MVTSAELTAGLAAIGSAGISLRLAAQYQEWEREFGKDNVRAFHDLSCRSALPIDQWITLWRRYAGHYPSKYGGEDPARWLEQIQRLIDDGDTPLRAVASLYIEAAYGLECAAHKTRREPSP
jgi:hypothetical protein